MQYWWRRIQQSPFAFDRFFSSGGWNVWTRRRPENWAGAYLGDRVYTQGHTVVRVTAATQRRARQKRSQARLDFVQELHTGRELLVRPDVFHAAGWRRDAESDQRPRAGRRVLGVRGAHVGHVHRQFGRVSDRRTDASTFCYCGYTPPRTRSRRWWWRRWLRHVWWTVLCIIYIKLSRWNLIIFFVLSW